MAEMSQARWDIMVKGKIIRGQKVQDLAMKCRGIGD